MYVFKYVLKGLDQMNWTEVNIYTTTEGIEPVCGCLLCIGVTGFVIKDAKDFEDFLADKTGNWDYIDDDLMDLKNCETCVTVYLPENSQGADMLSAIRSAAEAVFFQSLLSCSAQRKQQLLTLMPIP